MLALLSRCLLDARATGCSSADIQSARVKVDDATRARRNNPGVLAVRAYLSFLLLAAVGAAAVADDGPTGRTQTFIAPSGEPFRVGSDQPYPVGKWFAGADKNGDGKLDLAEFEADFLRFFDVLDVNHDGAIDGIERTRYENQVAPETLGSSWALDSRREEEAEDVDFGSGDDQGASTMKRDKPKYGANPIGAARFDLLGMPEPVAAMDAELRGRISRRVAEEAARQRFGLLDEQNLGYVTLASLPPTYAEGRHHGRGKQQKRR
jgi:hypothetical protein